MDSAAKKLSLGVFSSLTVASSEIFGAVSSLFTGVVAVDGSSLQFNFDNIAATYSPQDMLNTIIQAGAVGVFVSKFETIAEKFNEEIVKRLRISDNKDKSTPEEVTKNIAVVAKNEKELDSEMVDKVQSGRHATRIVPKSVKDIVNKENTGITNKDKPRSLEATEFELFLASIRNRGKETRSRLF